MKKSKNSSSEETFNHAEGYLAKIKSYKAKEFVAKSDKTWLSYGANFDLN